MEHQTLRLARLIAAIVVIGFGCTKQAANSMRPLEYDQIHTFKVGKHPVTIETKSFSFTKGDNGPAQLIISTNGTETSLSSRFNNDLWLNIRPGYLSWQDVDQDQLRDLVIWTPALDQLVASAYISGQDGTLHQLADPLQQPLPEAPGFW